mgnify:CR=1 FL=1
MQNSPCKINRTFLKRLPHNADLLLWLEKFCRKHNIRTGLIQVIGAVKRAVIGYYGQKERTYTTLTLNKALEIGSCIGNVSIKDKKVMVHAHIVLSNKKGKAFAGHLMPGTTIFAGEVYIQELSGTVLVRKFDETTGLMLWKNEQDE